MSAPFVWWTWCRVLISVCGDEVLENLAAQAADYLEERALLRRPANFQLLQQLSSGDDAASETAPGTRS